MVTKPSLFAIKAAQATHFLMNQAASDPHSVDGNKYLKLVKLLWAADRHGLRNFGRGVTNDHYSALSFGPVASGTYDLIKACDPNNTTISWAAEADANFWREHFEKRRDYSLEIIGDPGSGYLSRADVMMLERAYESFRTAPRFDMSNDISHVYPEWGTAWKSKPISKKSAPIDSLKFFDDPVAAPDKYFQVEPDVLKAAKYFYTQRQNLSRDVGIEL